jgi:hypothetical protein
MKDWEAQRQFVAVSSVQTISTPGSRMTEAVTHPPPKRGDNLSLSLAYFDETNMERP